ncbi:MMPL family transporter [Paenibacillus sp. GCM10023252]|uniref:MMPL family transporter n=1 Tax=Paenibacillus sp. GCM10023252 TaxID=3252649 RepID=UPI003606FDEF
MLEKISDLVAGRRGRWVTLVVWIAAAVLLTMLLPAVGERETNNAPNLETDSPSVLADKIIKEQFPSSSGIPALVVWHREGGLTPEDYQAIQATSKELSEKPLESQIGMAPLHELPPPALTKMGSKDGTTFVMPISFEETTDTEVSKENVTAIQERVTAAVGGKDPFETAIDDGSELSVRVTGPVGIAVDATGLFEGADVSLLIATVLLVLILLLIIYRSPILAIVPLIGVGFAYFITSPLLGWMADQGWITVDSQAISIMTVLLFGAGTDYCLFLISHYRQELTRESNKFIALRKAFKDGSGAIAMSGFTVVLSLFALLAAKYGAFHRFAIPFSLSILIMGIASLTLIPALLSLLGRASFYPFIPRTEEMEQERARKKGKVYKRRDDSRKLGAKVGNLVVRKPWTVVITCVVVLSILAGFATQIKFTYDILSSFPEDMPSREGFKVISEAYTPGDLAPATVVVQTDGKSAAEVKNELAAVSQVSSVGEAVPSKNDPNLQSFSVIFNINPYSMDAMEAIPVLREQAAEALEQAGVANAEDKVWVGGQTATQYDTKELTDRDTLVIIPIVIVLIMVLLVAYLRSVTAMVYLMATVILSYGSALGLGWIILHYFMGADAIQGSIPLYAFVFLVALGEDYNIFMISSIWQKRKIMPLRQAIREGVAETGGVITSAGLILAATFAVLATLPIQVLVQFGLVTAIGVLMDTFIVRPFLVPAITSLLGKSAFWPAKVQLIEEEKSTQA